MKMLLVHCTLFFSISCSAPEVLPPTRKLSPAEKEGRAKNQSKVTSSDFATDILSKSQEIDSINERSPDFGGLSSDSESNKNPEDNIIEETHSQQKITSIDVEKLDVEDKEGIVDDITNEEETKKQMDEELKISMLQPPFTSWTKQPTAILNPQGKAVFELTRTAVRLEVQKIRYGYAQVICSGCQGANHNQAGWISNEFLTTYNAYGSQQMKKILQWRDALTTKESIGGMETIDFCKAIDAGFVVNDTSFIFSQFSISTDLSMSSLQLKQPLSDIKGWGCGVKKAKIDD